MIFYDYWRSSSGWRVRIALGCKGISVERRAVNLLEGGQDAPAFRALNPMGQVPVLVLDDGGGAAARIITQSQAILAYLEERFPTPPLLPEGLWLRAKARQLSEMVNAGIQPFQNLALLDQLRARGLGDSKQIAHHFNARGLAALETAALETAGTFMVGGAPTIADVYLVPQMYSARRFGVDLAPYPTLRRVEAACAALAPFKAAHPDAQSDARPDARGA